ncbi:MAG: hypothetical protein JO257_10415 [Deltaproteobacteria bacterium]|nr:hypothetical protein [Deltaproteobacteria bacterium]
MAALLVMLFAARAAAEPADLAWQAPAACPDAASVRDRIEARLGRTLDDADDVAIDVAKQGRRYVAHVDLGAVTVANDVRTVTSARCDELADAVAVIVARAAGERRIHAEKHIAPKPSDATTSLAMRDADDDSTPTAIVATVEPARPRVWSLDVRLSGVSGIGVIPKVGLGGELAVTLRRKTALAELAETRWVMSAAQIHTGAPARVDVGLDATALRLGWRSPAMPLRAWASAEAGSMYGTGVHLDSSQLGSGRWVAAGAGFGVAWPINRWVRLVGTTEIMVAVERVRFSLGDGMTVYAPSPASARATCGLEIGLP